MRAIVSVIGLDRVGITAEVCALLAENKINILDINQTVMSGFFTMTMLVDTSAYTQAFSELRQALSRKGQDMQLSIEIQREDIFTAMHTI